MLKTLVIFFSSFNINFTSAVGKEGADSDPLGGGYDDLFKAETNCPAFKCGKGKIPVQRGFADKKNSPVVYGCDRQSFDMMSMLDPSNPNSLSKGKNSDRLWKCCTQRDLSQQICGMSKTDVEAKWKTCYKKKCGSDQSCTMSAQFGAMGLGGGYGKDDKCKEYYDSQQANCECVDKKEEEERFRTNIEKFYGIFAKDKLPSGSKKVDSDWMKETVYKKFKKGQEKDIWTALFDKYGKKFTHKEKPKPNYADMYKDDHLKDDLYNDKEYHFDKKKDKEGKKDKAGEKKESTTTSTTTTTPKADPEEYSSSFGEDGEVEEEEL